MKVYKAGLLPIKKCAEKLGMNNAMWSISALDFYFPFFIFGYGLVVNFILEIPQLASLARREMPSQYATFYRHQKIAILSIYLGGLWSLQNLWFR